jgi:hypothetical protein
MKEPYQHDPLDILGEVYEKMYESVAENFHKAEEKSGPILHKLVDEAREEVVKLKDISEEGGEKLAQWLRRDLDDAVNYMAETGDELKDWLGFEISLLESRFIDLLLNAADKTTLKLIQMKEDAEKNATYYTDEITGPGTLNCTACGEKLHFYKSGKVPPCPKCHTTVFQRKTSN